MTRRPLLTPPVLGPAYSSEPAELELEPEASAGGPEHLAEIDLEAIERGEDGQAASAPTSAADGFLSPEAFQAGLEAGLSLAGHLSGLSTLLRSPAEPTFPPAARALYDTILDVPALHFLVRPGGVWIQRAATIGLFAVPLAAGVAGELRARRARPVAEHRVAEPDDQAHDQAETPA